MAPRKPDLDKVVELLNVARKTLGIRGKLKNIPKGEPGSPYRCPIAIALHRQFPIADGVIINEAGGLKLGKAWGRKTADILRPAWGNPREQHPVLVPFPRPLQAFQELFDNYKYPELLDAEAKRQFKRMKGTRHG